MIISLKVNLFWLAGIDLNCSSNILILNELRTRHSDGPVILFEINILLFCYYFRIILFMSHLPSFIFHWLNFSHTLFSLMYYCSLTAQYLPSFLKGCYDIHIFTDFSSFNQCYNTFI